MILVGVGGARGSGKNTFAKLCIEILEEKGYTALEMSWAARLKESAFKTFGFKGDGKAKTYNDWADEFKSIGKVKVTFEDKAGSPYEDVEITGREFLQNYGTEAHRKVFADNFWVDAFWETNRFGDDSIVFVCDTRFDNEAKSIVDHGGINIRIQRDEVEESLEDTHASEAGFDPQYLDVVIENNGSMEDLQVAAETFVASILAGEELKAQLQKSANEYHERIDR